MQHPSLGGLSALLPRPISREALHQRFTAPAATFLARCLHEGLRHKFCSPTLPPKCLRPFGRVWLVDSSSWAVHEKLRAVLPGSGGNASMANYKIQLAYDYKQGELRFLADTAGTVPDNRYTAHLPALVKKADLLLIDQGYFKLDTFQAIMAKGAYFLTRFRLGTTLQAAQTQAPFDLGTVLRRSSEAAVELSVHLGQGKQRTAPCRLVCLRVSEQVATERRRRVKDRARQKGRTVRAQQLAWCDWTLFLTNVPATWLPREMVRALYTLRWQIELLFKQLKSILRVHQSSTGNIHRLRCELYGKLLAAVWVHRLHAVANTARWQAARQEISIEKLYKRVQERAFTLAQLVLWSLPEISATVSDNHAGNPGNRR
jgi:hypothetical protein